MLMAQASARCHETPRPHCCRNQSPVDAPCLRRRPSPNRPSTRYPNNLGHDETRLGVVATSTAGPLGEVTSHVPHGAPHAYPCAQLASTKEEGMPGKLRHRTLTRRTFIKASAATGAA